MTIAVRYFTKSGNTEKLARAIADELNTKAKSVDEPLEGPVDLLFLCNSVYYAGMNAKVRKFVNENARNIGRIVNVSTAALIDSTYRQMQGVAKDAGVELSTQEFHCRGSFSALHAGHPDEKDLEKARRFARNVCAQASKDAVA